MAVETHGTVEMKGDTGPGVAVDVFVDRYRIRLVSGHELIGEWERDRLGVRALNDGFAIKAEGEEFLLRTEEDVAVAEELGLMASSPRMARKVAASHPPEERATGREESPAPSNLGALVFALGGVLVLAGGFLLRTGSDSAVTRTDQGGAQFWLAFLVGGVLMAGAAFIMSINIRVARIVAVIVLLGVVVVFALAAQDAVLDAGKLLAYGFIAGGIVAGVAVIFSGGFGGGHEPGR